MRRSIFPVTVLAFGYAFLYVPIVLLIIYSFNDNRLVTVWSHFSTRWYGELFHNAKIGDALWLSLRVAAMSATASVVLGTMAAFVMQRAGRFFGRTAFEALATMPLILPEVLTGLSLLVLFVMLGDLIGWPAQRGASTITLAHIPFGMAYALVVVRARLSQLDPGLEDAAADLGATPWRTFVRITMPLLMPAIVAAWLLAFTLSLDDVVIASFVTGPGASTLPIVIFSSVRLGVSPQINALATLIVLAIAVLIVTAMVLLQRAERTARQFET
jgi:putrescine transport system permease protein